MPPVSWSDMLSFVQPVVILLVTFALREARALAKEVQQLKTRQYRHAVYVAAKFNDPLPDFMEE